MTREEIEDRVLPLIWEWQPYDGGSHNYLAKTWFDFNLRIVTGHYGDCVFLLKEDINGRCMEKIELDSEWKAYKLGRIWQINKLCEILQIKSNECV